MVHDKGTEIKLQEMAVRFLRNNSSYWKKQNKPDLPTETGLCEGKSRSG